MSFRLVPNSVTLGDLERRNDFNGRVISPNSVGFMADYVKVVEDAPIQRKCKPKNLVFNDNYHLWRLAGGDPRESVKVRHSPLARENLTNNQP